MTHWRKEVSKDSPHLRWWDIEGKTPLAVTVESVQYAKFREDPAPDDTQDDDRLPRKEGTLFIKFKGARKDLGLNVTNGLTMEAHFGPDYEQWAGKQVVLRIAECRKTKCIRIDTKPGQKFPREIPKWRWLDNAAKADGER